MGTRGLKVWRYRKRYYATYNHWDSYPKGLGKELVSDIPTDPEAYQQWLEDKRKLVAEWHEKYEQFLTVVSDVKVSTDLPDELTGEYHPTYFAPANDLYIEWVYTFDLDNETFTVNNGAHFKLNKIPRQDDQWMGALADGPLGDKIVLPGKLPEDSIAHLDVVYKPAYDRNMGTSSHGKGVAPKYESKIVRARNIDSIPWNQRHGATMRMLIYYMFRWKRDDALSMCLLQWTPDDFPFREIAYAILCLAAGGKYTSITLEDKILQTDEYGFIEGGEEEEENDGDDNESRILREHVSKLASGSHLKGLLPGSAPNETIYWMNGALIFLTRDLHHPDVLENQVEWVVEHCQQHDIKGNANAMLLSIDHVVLIKIFDGGLVEHTEVMALWYFQKHMSLDVRLRYKESYLERLASGDERLGKWNQNQVRKRYNAGLKDMGMHVNRAPDEEAEAIDEAEPSLDPTYPDHVKCQPDAVFYALVNFFDAAARQQMPPMRKGQQGVFPNEIYALILDKVNDAPTRNACMEVSRTFRDLCLENYLFTEDTMILPSDSCKDILDHQTMPKYYIKKDLTTGEESKVQLKFSGGFLPSWDRERKNFKVLTGDEKNRRSMVPLAPAFFAEYVEKKDIEEEKGEGNKNEAEKNEGSTNEKDASTQSPSAEGVPEEKVE